MMFALLSSRLYCRHRNFTDSTLLRSRAVPPVWNFTKPRRHIIYLFLLYYSLPDGIVKVFPAAFYRAASCSYSLTHFKNVVWEVFKSLAAVLDVNSLLSHRS